MKWGFNPSPYPDNSNPGHITCDLCKVKVRHNTSVSYFLTYLLFICIFISTAVNQGTLIFIYYCTVLRVLYLRRRCVGRADRERVVNGSENRVTEKVNIFIRYE